MTKNKQRRWLVWSAAAITSLTGCGPQELSEPDVQLSGDPLEGNVETLSAGLCTVTISPARELFIRALSVVNDPVRTKPFSPTNNSTGAGQWTFGKLMSNMAGDIDPSEFVRKWLAEWETAQVVNGNTVNARTQIRNLVIDPWLSDSGGTKLDLKKAPFRLLAITNRMDLRNLPAGNAGEGRFVFGVLGPTGAALSFTVILEYKLPATTQAELNEWADQWHELGTLAQTDPTYNVKLQALTTRFAGKNAAPGRQNGSSIGQVRTNEIALASPWQLRQFQLGAAGFLAQTTVNKTPISSLNNTAAVADYVNANEAAILTETHSMPAEVNGAPFRGGSANTPEGMFWRAPGITNNLARHRFSLNTCNGCHAGETGTSFLHVDIRSANTISALSQFITGGSVPDPVNGTLRTFNETTRRSDDLKNILCGVAAPATFREN